MTDGAYTPPGRPAGLAPGETWCRCGAIWRAASRLCHCAREGCHRTFTGLAGFDAHQVTICDRCTPAHPCPHGSHHGRWSVSCLTGGPTPTEVVADDTGRYKAPGGDVERLTAGRRNGAL